MPQLASASFGAGLALVCLAAVVAPVLFRAELPAALLRALVLVAAVLVAAVLLLAEPVVVR